MNMKTKIKAILTIIFSSVLILSMSACKTTEESDRSSSEPTEITATTTTATLPTTTTATTATTRKTTTSKATTTTTTATTTVTTTTTAPTATQLTTTTVATTTTTAVPVVATTTTTTTAAPIVATTTTTAPAVVTMASNVASTVYMIQDTVTLEYVPITVYYYDEQPENATLQAYSDLAETGILTDEIRELITKDVMNYANAKYGFVLHEELYANSTTDYNGGFHGGATNGEFRMNFYTYACMIKWGAMNPDYICPSLNDNAKQFQSAMYGWVDYTAESLIEEGYDLSGWSSNVGFCWLGENALGGAVVSVGDTVYENGGKVYQVSFIY